MPDTPAWARASRTSSSLNGRMIAVISFMFASRWWKVRPVRPGFGSAETAGPARPGAPFDMAAPCWPRHTDSLAAPDGSWGRSCRPIDSFCPGCSSYPSPAAAARPPAWRRVWCVETEAAREGPRRDQSVAVVQLVFQRVGRGAELGDLLHLQRD